ncbi:MAG: hypothetical protein WA269_10645 [Candidatus Udaeobacter sp.]
MSQLTLTGLALPLFLLFASPPASAPKAFGATKETPESQGQTGTLQKMIVQSGSVTTQFDLNRLNGIATPCIGQYVFEQIGGSIVPGTTDSGNHGDNQVTNIALPFSYTLYDQTFNSINVSSNGNAQFTTTDTDFTNVCPLPWTSHNYTIFPYWDDQRTDANSGCSAFPGGNCGVFTSVSGTAPHRIFNIEWRTVYFAAPTTTANYELRLYEGQIRFDVIYGAVASGNTSATAGVQRDNVTQYFCNGSGGTATGGQSYVYVPRPCPTPTPRRLSPPPRPRPTPLPRP